MDTTYVIATGCKQIFYIGTLNNPERLKIEFEKFYFPKFIHYENIFDEFKNRIREYFRIDDSLQIDIIPTNDALKEIYHLILKNKKFISSNSKP